jgi:hypothetical protein
MPSSRNEITICSAQDDGTYAVALPERADPQYNDPRFIPAWTLYITGTFDSADVTIAISSDGGTTYTNVPDAIALNAATVLNMQFRATHVRAVIANSTTAASLTVVLM